MQYVINTGYRSQIGHVWGVSVQGVYYVLGGMCPGGKCPGGKCPEGICSWGKCSVGTCPGVSVLSPFGSITRRLVKSNVPQLS